MNTATEGRIDVTVRTNVHGRAVIEQSNGACVVLSPDQILSVIEQLHVCYDYCAAWKAPMNTQDPTATEIQS
jgi:hypothetical protein